MLKSDRLLIREVFFSDAEAIQKLAGDKDVASTTLNIPHPYTLVDAINWISRAQIPDTSFINFSILLDNSEFIGCISLLDLNKIHERCYLGYWIGKPYWNNGYATEAGKAIINYAFKELNYNKICATHMTRNPASGKVLRKIGFLHEGSLKSHIKKGNTFENIETYGIIK